MIWWVFCLREGLQQDSSTSLWTARSKTVGNYLLFSDVRRRSPTLTPFNLHQPPTSCVFFQHLKCKVFLFYLLRSISQKASCKRPHSTQTTTKDLLARECFLLHNEKLHIFCFAGQCLQVWIVQPAAVVENEWISCLFTSNGAAWNARTWRLCPLRRLSPSSACDVKSSITV